MVTSHIWGSGATSLYHVHPPEPPCPERSWNRKSGSQVAHAESAPHSFDKHMRGLRRRDSSLSIRSILAPCSVIFALHGWSCSAKSELYSDLLLIARARGTACDILLSCPCRRNAGVTANLRPLLRETGRRRISHAGSVRSLSKLEALHPPELWSPRRP